MYVTKICFKYPEHQIPSKALLNLVPGSFSPFYHPCFLLDIIPLGRFHLCRNALMQLTQITFRPFTLAVMVNFFGHASME